jgi:hypothetical protein
VTCIREDEGGRLLLGYRQAGFEIFERKTLKSIYRSSDDVSVKTPANPRDYVTSILASPPLVGWYGGGLTSSDLFEKTWQPASATTGTSTTRGRPPLPSRERAPSLANLEALLGEVAKIPAWKPASGVPTVIALGDDWSTKGDWLGRYGRYWACLCAICSPCDYVWGAGERPVCYSSRIGLNCTPGDSVRYWVHGLYTQNQNTLELPPVYLDNRIKKGYTSRENHRREAEQDDHGETYPMSLDGPDLYTNLCVPPGSFCLSIYDFNKDGHTESNRFRDYRISIRSLAANRAPVDLDSIEGFDRQPELAHARIRDFWGGVYKRFLVLGPANLTVAVKRNYSFNTILPGLFLDLLEEEPAPYFTLQSGKHIAKDPNRSGFSASPELEASERLFEAVEHLRQKNPVWWARESPAIYGILLRAFRRCESPVATESGAGSLDPRLLQARIATCCYQLRMFSRWEELEKALGLIPAREIEKALRSDGEEHLVTSSPTLPESSGAGRWAVVRYLRELNKQ